MIPLGFNPLYMDVPKTPLGQRGHRRIQLPRHTPKYIGPLEGQGHKVVTQTITTHQGDRITVTTTTHQGDRATPIRESNPEPTPTTTTLSGKRAASGADTSLGLSPSSLAAMWAAANGKPGTPDPVSGAVDTTAQHQGDRATTIRESNPEPTTIEDEYEIIPSIEDGYEMFDI
jgi:hypothetical protein